MGCPVGECAVERAAAAPTPDCLRFLLERGFPKTVGAAVAAAKAGNVRNLEVLRAFRCPLDLSVYDAASTEECRRYLERHGCCRRHSHVTVTDELTLAFDREE